jgi:hypothetical protein
MMKTPVILLALMILGVIACNKKTIDKTIVLKIGKLEITQYEFEKNKTRGLVVNSADSSALDDPQKVKLWKEQFVDRCFIIEDAYQKRFDTISGTKMQIKYVGDFMMVQRYGYLWKERISPIVDANKK